MAKQSEALPWDLRVALPDELMDFVRASPLPSPLLPISIDGFGTLNTGETEVNSDQSRGIENITPPPFVHRNGSVTPATETSDALITIGGPLSLKESFTDLFLHGFFMEQFGMGDGMAPSWAHLLQKTTVELCRFGGPYSTVAIALRLHLVVLTFYCALCKLKVFSTTEAGLSRVTYVPDNLFPTLVQVFKQLTGSLNIIEQIREDLLSDRSTILLNDIHQIRVLIDRLMGRLDFVGGVEFGEVYAFPSTLDTEGKAFLLETPEIIRRSLRLLAFLICERLVTVLGSSFQYRSEFTVIDVRLISKWGSLII